MSMLIFKLSTLIDEAEDIQHLLELRMDYVKTAFIP